MTRSHWRFTAAAGLLAAGLMTNAGGAVALADSGSGDSSGADGAGPSSSSSTPAKGPLGDIAKNVRATIQGAADALNPAHLSGPHSTVGATGSTNGSPIFALPQMVADGIRAHATITGVSAPRQNAAKPTNDPVTPRPAVVVPNTVKVQEGVSDAVTSLTTALTQTTNQVAQATNAVVAPATAAVAAGVQGVVAPLSAGLASVTAPIPDVLTSIQAMLTSTADAVAPVTQVPADLYFLFGITGGQPVSGQVGADADRPSTSPLPTPLQTVRPAAVDRGLPAAIADDAVATAPATATAMSGATSAIAGASSLNATARTAPADAMSEGVQEFLHSYGALVIAASLSALIAAALPGFLAFLIPTAAGVGVGYRQAKAGIALRGPALARFAGSGPIGIVRSGSMITIGPRALRVARPARRELASQSHLAA